MLRDHRDEEGRRYEVVQSCGVGQRDDRDASKKAKKKANLLQEEAE